MKSGGENPETPPRAISDGAGIAGRLGPALDAISGLVFDRTAGIRESKTMGAAEIEILPGGCRGRRELRPLLLRLVLAGTTWVAGQTAFTQVASDVPSGEQREAAVVASGEDAAPAAVVERRAIEAAPSSGEAKPPIAPGSQPPAQPPSADSKDGSQGSSAKPPEQPGKKPEENAPGGVVNRPMEPESPPNPEELNVRPDATGKVRVNFRNQPWPKIMEWLADISGMSLDWRELPGDYLNLVTRDSYTVEEMRNLINQHLFHRGFTMIRRGEVLMVVNLEKVDPGLVPRVTLEDLDRLPDFDFVRVSFALDWILADKAAEELKPYLSPRGKLVPLPTTNRLEAMDAAVNLRELARLLREEQSPKGQERLVREFVLQYARAEETAEQLKDLMGLKQSGFPMPPGMNPQQIQQMQQAMMAAQQQMQQMQGGPGGPQPGGKGPPGFKTASDVNFVVNKRRNSIVAQAPPDKMAVIEQAVKILDVPSDTGAFLAGMSRWQVYRLAAVDPEPLAKTLEELGGLDPSARIEVDKANNALIVYAPLADHVTIRAVIERLDGSGRRFEVIQLRRLPADYVAGTIDFMMGGQRETASSTPSWLPPWERDRQRQSKKNPNEFRVDADVENNRLLLWANEIEIQEVQNLLVKLGEVPAGEAAASRVRVLEGLSPEDAAAVLEALRRQWPAMAPNPIRIEQAPGPTSPDAPGKDGPESRPESDQPADLRRQADAEAGVPPPRSVPRGDPSAKIAASTAVLTLTEASPTEPPRPAPDAGAPSSQLPPLIVTQTPDGRIVITCQDPRAMELVDFLLRDVVPPKPDYRIFRLRYAWADNVVKVLETLFSEKKTESRFSWWYFDPWMSPQSETKEPSRLSSRRPVKFVADLDTNTVLVQNADARQLAQIEQIIQFYDQPPPQDSESVRVTEIFRIRYSKASQVAAAVKEVYRDLLSPDENRRDNRGGILLLLDGGQGDARTPRFKGLLSIGVDDLSNTLLVSAPVYLMNDIRKLIQELDQAAEPVQETVEVIQLGPGVSAESVRRSLGDLLGTGGGGKGKSGEGKSSPAVSPPGSGGQRESTTPR